MKFIAHLFSSIVLLLSGNVLKRKEKQAQYSLNRAKITPSFYRDSTTTIKYWKGGSGPVVLFIHGFGFNAMLTWQRELKELSKTHTVVALDILWFGESTTSLAPTLATQTEAILKLITHLGYKKVSLVGQSYGGFISINFAEHYPSMVEKMCIVSCPGPVYDTAELDTICTNFSVKSINELLVADNPTMLRKYMDLCLYKHIPYPAFVIKNLYSSYFAPNKEQKLQLLDELFINESLRKVHLESLRKIPCNIIWSDEDEIFSLKGGKLLADSLGATFVSIPACGHSIQIESPNQLTKEIAKVFK
jgi:pimeloyl-ACP methyl ester carboxylesterase